MFEICLLTHLNLEELHRIVTGYTADSKYEVRHTESEEHILFELRQIALPEPLIKRYAPYDQETVQRYNRVLADACSFGAYDGALLTGLIIAEPHFWNHSFWVWEFHVAEGYRRLGIGRQLMDAVVEKARHKGFRTIICETQNTNVPAIKAYHQLGFRLEGVDISYYTNADYPDGEIAVFMKRRLT